MGNAHRAGRGEALATSSERGDVQTGQPAQDLSTSSPQGWPIYGRARLSLLFPQHPKSPPALRCPLPTVFQEASQADRLIPSWTKSSQGGLPPRVPPTHGGTLQLSLGWAVALFHRSPMEPWQLKSNCFCHSLLSLPTSSSSPLNGTSSQVLGIADQVSHSDPMEALDGPSQTTLSLPMLRPGTPLDRAGLLGIVRQGSWAPLSAWNMPAWSLDTDPFPWGSGRQRGDLFLPRTEQARKGHGGSSPSTQTLKQAKAGRPG